VVGVGTQQQRPGHGQRPLEPVREELLGIADVADDLQRAPPPGNGPGE
jgi:hypothetical protein